MGEGASVDYDVPTALRLGLIKVVDYLAFGVPHVWIIDPELRKGYVCSRTGFQEPEGGLLTIPGSPIRVVLSEMFAELDRA